MGVSSVIDAAKGRFRRGLVRVLTRTARVPGARTVSNAGMKHIFNQVAGTWDIIRRDPLYIEALVAALDIAEREAGEHGRTWPPESVLDAGCGTGLATTELVRRFPTALVHGVDIAPDMIEYARKRDLPAVFAVADTTIGRFPARSYDMIVALDGVFSASVLAGSLNPGGQILIVYSRGKHIPVSRKPADLKRAFEAEGLNCVYFTGPDDAGWESDAWLILASRPKRQT